VTDKRILIERAATAAYAFRRRWIAARLISCGVSLSANAYRMGVYIDKILKGANPPELPLEFPSLKTGDQTQDCQGAWPDRAAVLIARADEVIEYSATVCCGASVADWHLTDNPAAPPLPDFSLAPRAPSIHGTSLRSRRCNI